MQIGNLSKVNDHSFFKLEVFGQDVSDVSLRSRSSQVNGRVVQPVRTPGQQIDPSEQMPDREKGRRNSCFPQDPLKSKDATRGSWLYHQEQEGATRGSWHRY